MSDKPTPKYGFLVMSIKCDEVMSVQHIGGDMFEMAVVAVARAHKETPHEIVIEQLMTPSTIINFPAYSPHATSVSVIKLNNEPF